MFEETLIRIISEAGMGIGSIIALVIVVIYQMKLMSKMTDHLGELSENVQENTSTLKSLKRVVEDSNNK